MSAVVSAYWTRSHMKPQMRSEVCPASLTPDTVTALRSTQSPAPAAAVATNPVITATELSSAFLHPVASLDPSDDSGGAGRGR